MFRFSFKPSSVYKSIFLSTFDVQIVETLFMKSILYLAALARILSAASS